VIKFPSNETVAILNEGDIELSTGNTPNAKVIMTAPSVETTGDVFVKGNAEGISAQLASLKTRLQSAEDEITTIKTEIASLLSSETDPQVGTVTQDKWCVGTSGGQVECTANQPLLSYTETDPKVSTVTQDKWCVGTSGGQVECTANQPLLSYTETDPKVSTVTQDKWCVGTSGGQVECSQEAPVSAPPSCSNDGLLTYDGSQYLCRCINGYSGLLCEVPKSLSALETLEMSKVSNAQAAGDSGNDGTNVFSNIIDGDVSTTWVSSGDADEYVEFDLQTAVKTVALAVKLPLVSYTRGLPRNMKLEVSNTGHTGPWVTAKDFELVGTDKWQIFDIPTFAIGYRYYRLYVVDSYVSGYNARISEIEFFQNNIGTRIAPAVDPQNLPRGSIAGISATDECHRDNSNRQTYGCSRLSIWPVVAKNPDAWGCESGSTQYTSYYGHHAHQVCECVDGWQGVHIPSGNSYGYATILTCIRV